MCSETTYCIKIARGWGDSPGLSFFAIFVCILSEKFMLPVMLSINELKFSEQ